MKNTRSYVRGLRQIGKTDFGRVGSKGANLGELLGAGGFRVPDGFCVTTEAYQEVIANNPELNSLLDQLADLKAEERSAIGKISAKIRDMLENAPVAGTLVKAIEEHLVSFEAKEAFAVRSSATAEDLPTASFAGQQDTFLNVTGKEAVLRHISKCWASLFTDRAVTYRIQNDFDSRKVRLAVVVQKMVFPQVAGILFTADPVTSNRKISSIDASFGLGEAVVSGLVNPDNYKVSEGRIVDKRISLKKRAVRAIEAGGTVEQKIVSEQQNRQALTDEQILELERLGRAIETHFGCPQDIEWCLAENVFYIVQSRPITTLYPVPVAGDDKNHVYISVGHQQMMTDAMKPLGLSLWKLTAGRPMSVAGGRLFVDVTNHLVSPATRKGFLDMLGRSDPLISDALISLLERGDFIKPEPDKSGE